MFQGLCHASLRSSPGRCGRRAAASPCSPCRSFPCEGAAHSSTRAQGRSHGVLQTWPFPGCHGAVLAGSLSLSLPSGIPHIGKPAAQCSLAAVLLTMSIGTKTSFKYTLILSALFSSYSKQASAFTFLFLLRFLHLGHFLTKNFMP